MTAGRGDGRARALREAAAFVALAVALAWAAWAPLVLAGAVVEAGRWPTHLPGLAAPAAAAVLLAALGGRAARADLAARLAPRPPFGRAAVLALAPLPVLLAAPLLGGDWAGLARYSGLPVLHPAAVALVVFLVNGLGEEVGWRGYLLPRLQLALGLRRGTLASGAVWALWHLPMVLVLATYREMGPVMLLLGVGLGLLAGAFVLAHVAAAAGVAGAALWHTLFNLATATGLGGAAGPVLTAAAMVWALLLWRFPARLAVAPPGRAAPG